MVKKLKAGIIGCGRIAGLYSLECTSDFSLTHACGYTKNDKVELVAVCDPSEHARKKFSKAWKIPNSFSNSEEMLDNVDLDIISICSPTDYRLNAFEHISRIKAIKGIFCEKPLANSLEESIKIFELSKDINVAVNYFRRWNPSLKKIYENLREEKYGKVISVNCVYTKGLLVNGSHMIDLLCWFFGTPINAIPFNTYKREDMDHGVSFTLTFEQGIDATVINLPNAPYVYLEIDIFTNLGKLTISQRGQRVYWYEKQKDTNYQCLEKLSLISQKETEWQNCPSQAIDELINVINNKGELSCTIQDALRVNEICDQIKSSEHNGSF